MVLSRSSQSQNKPSTPEIKQSCRYASSAFARAARPWRRPNARGGGRKCKTEELAAAAEARMAHLHVVAQQQQLRLQLALP